MLLPALQIRHFIYFARAFIFSARAFTGSSRELGSRPRGGFLCQNRSLVPRPRPSTRERGSGDFSRFSWHFVRFKSCDTCLCACAFQQRARIAKLRVLSCPGGGVWVAHVTNCVTSEILQSDWTIPKSSWSAKKID